MPVLVLPGQGSPTGAAATTTPAATESQGKQALDVALLQVGKPYGWGATGPDSFDCSGLTSYSYANGPHIDIGRTVGDQWQSPNLTTVWDNQTLGWAGIGASTSILQPGDLIMYFPAGAYTADDSHVVMAVDNAHVVSADSPGSPVGIHSLPTNADGTIGAYGHPFRGVRRPTGSGASENTSGQGDGSGNNPSSGSGSTLTVDKGAAALMKNLPDPRSNLPFSAYFQGQIVPGSNPFGSLEVVSPRAGNRNAAAQLVRGGMAETISTTNPFKCYFMMNPQEIAVNAGIDTSNLSIFLQNPDVLQSGGYPVTNQTISFTVYFNRMYEVWNGDPNGPASPATEGCRWDTRALERLLGIFDATVKGDQDNGQGNNGWGMWPAQMLPLIVVFGGKNALRFQGLIASFDYTFTIFDANMIPVEAYADISVMRVYNPSQVDLNTVSSLVTTTGQSGPQNGSAYLINGQGLSAGTSFTAR